jgi:hypothetical protein
MVKVDAIEGTVDGMLWCHYDVANDVLYLRLNDHRGTPTIAEETAEGLLTLRPEDGGPIVGMTVVNWWKRFGTGRLPDSIRELEAAIEPWARRLAA